MVILVLRHTCCHRSMTSLLSFTPSLKCLTALGLFTPTVQINITMSSVFYCLSMSSSPLCFQACAACFHLQLCLAKAISARPAHCKSCLHRKQAFSWITPKDVKSELRYFPRLMSHPLQRGSINLESQTPQTPDDPMIVYSGTQTQPRSSHLPYISPSSF